MEPEPKSETKKSSIMLGNRKCPHCGEKVDAKRLYLGNHLWAKWLCPNCQSLLSFDTRRRTIITLIFCSALVILMVVDLIGIQFFLPILVLYAASLMLWESVVLLEPPSPLETLQEEETAAEQPENESESNA